jgi:PKHD-type hydroxylase
MSFLFNNNSNPTLFSSYIFDKAFTEEELQKLEEVQKLFPFEDAVLASDQGNIDHIRQSQIKWLSSAKQECHWIFMKFADLATKANAQMWGFDLTGMLENLQYAVYPAGAGHYTWHMDTDKGLAAQRKISITMQLSDPNDYEGGNLELFSSSNIQVAPKEKGTVVLFPSYMMHRVSPVTKGERRSLVLWVSGPPFR